MQYFRIVLMTKASHPKLLSLEPGSPYLAQCTLTYGS